MSHVLQHVAQLLHRLTCLIEDVPASIVVQIELVDLLLSSVDFTLRLLQLLKHVLSFELCGPSLVFNDVDGGLLIS